jgi:hypothetical protein
MNFHGIVCEGIHQDRSHAVSGKLPAHFNVSLDRQLVTENAFKKLN